MSRNLLIPFRRDKKRDLASGEGEDLLASKVEQVLATEGATNRLSGELPWRTSFGVPLRCLLHQRNDAVVAELARVWIRDALRKWLPEVKVVSVSAVRNGASLTLTIRYRAATDPSPTRTLSLSIAG